MKLPIIALALAATALATPITEVSSTGGTFSFGSGSFTINPFDVMVGFAPSDILLSTAGTITLPSAAGQLADPVLVGQLTVTAWGVAVPLDLYTQVWQKTPGVLAFSVQMTGITDKGNIPGSWSTRWIEFYYPSPTLAAPGSTQALRLHITAVDIGVPEPGAWTLAAIGLAGLFWRKRIR